MCNFFLHPQEKCHQYWPAERSARYQYFVVDPMAEYNMPQYILREFKVTDARVSSWKLCVRRLVLLLRVLYHHILYSSIPDPSMLSGGTVSKDVLSACCVCCLVCVLYVNVCNTVRIYRQLTLNYTFNLAVSKL